MLKFSLIVPNTRYNSDFLWSVLPSRGLLSIAACLEQAGHQVQYIDADFKNLSHNQIIEKVMNFGSNVVGITMNTFQAKSGLDLCKFIKSSCNNIKTIVGGPHPSSTKKDFLIENPCIDFACIGESEATIKDLADSINGKANIKSVKGIVYRSGEDVVVNAKRDFIEDLDSLPYPSYHLIEDIHSYPGAQPLKKSPSMHLLASRGCPYSCVFCTKSVWGKTVRSKTPKRIIDEVEYLHNKYGINEIFFQDDTMNLNREWFFEICDEIIGRGLNHEMSFKTSFRVNKKLVDKEILKKAKKAGFWIIFYGVESGNQDVLNTIKKGTTVSEIKRAFKLAHKAGIKTIAAFMVGNISETKETINDSIELAKEIRPDIFGFSIATPLPGTEFFDIANENNWINSNDLSQWSQFESVTRNADLKRNEISKLRDSADWQVRNYLGKLKSKEGANMSLSKDRIKFRIKNIPLLGPMAIQIWRLVKKYQLQRNSKVKQARRKLKAIKNKSKTPAMTGLSCQLVTQSQMESETFERWCSEIKETPRYHRKQWEYVYVLQALYENNLLQSGSSGLGFAVGQEPLPALMAKYGCEVIATDMDQDAAKEIGWVDSNQHSNSKNILNVRGICEPDKFNKFVSFQTADMNNIDDTLQSKKFDFIWSCCALEHLGSIKLGLKFAKKNLELLKPGGISIHTTEYNVLSNDDTLDNQGTVIFRKRDIEELIDYCKQNGYEISFNPHIGNGFIDKHFDVPPYKDTCHLKLLLDKYVSTSIGLLIKKSG